MRSNSFHFNTFLDTFSFFFGLDFCVFMLWQHFRLLDTQPNYIRDNLGQMFWYISFSFFVAIREHTLMVFASVDYELVWMAILVLGMYCQMGDVAFSIKHLHIIWIYPLNITIWMYFLSTLVIITGGKHHNSKDLWCSSGVAFCPCCSQKVKGLTPTAAPPCDCDILWIPGLYM